MGSGAGESRQDIFATCFAIDPVPIWVITLPTDGAWHQASFDWMKLMLSVDRELLGCSFRGVSLQRLPSVLRNGIDVEPSDAVIYVDDFTKAWEYGGFPKVLLALREERMRRTFIEMPAESPASELERLREEYQTEIVSRDGKSLWFSRLHPDDRRVNSGYEIAYARWIPGNAFEALAAVLVVSRPSDDLALKF